jgi:hypothetical protein
VRAAARPSTRPGPFRLSTENTSVHSGQRVLCRLAAASCLCAWVRLSLSVSIFFIYVIPAFEYYINVGAYVELRTPVSALRGVSCFDAVYCSAIHRTPDVNTRHTHVRHTYCALHRTRAPRHLSTVSV